MTTGLNLDEAQPKRRHDDVLEGAPWPVRAIAIIGGMTCIACFLVWFLANIVVSGQDDIKRAVAPLADHVRTSDKLGDTLQHIEQDHRDSNRRLERLLELMCWQQAKSETQRSTCMDVR